MHNWSNSANAKIVGHLTRIGYTLATLVLASLSFPYNNPKASDLKFPDGIVENAWMAQKTESVHCESWVRFPDREVVPLRKNFFFLRTRSVSGKHREAERTPYNWFNSANRERGHPDRKFIGSVRSLNKNKYHEDLEVIITNEP